MKSADLSSESPAISGEATPQRTPSEELFYGFSGPDASALLKAIEAGQDVSQFMSPDYVDKRLKKAKKLMGPEQEYRGLIVPNIPTGVQNAKAAMFGKAPSEVFVKQWALAPEFRGCARLIQTPTREEGDKHYKPGAGLKNLLSVALTTTTFFADRQIIVAFCQLPFDTFSPAQIRECYAWLERALKWKVTNGPLQGLYKRVIQSVGRPKPNKLPTLTGKSLKIRPDVFGNMTGLGLAQALEGVYLNQDSGAGFPWGTGKKREHLKEIFLSAGEILQAAANGKFVEYCTKHPTSFVWQLKNKLDLYEAESGPMQVEPRAYFVTPAAFGVLASCLMTRINKATVPFWDDPTSTSALCFSWMHGGGDRIHSWVATCKLRGPGYYGICYGDDQLHCMVVNADECYVSFQDASRFDLGLINEYGTSAYKKLSTELGERLDNTWRFLLQALCKYAFATPVAVGYSVMMMLVHCLKSGIAGTTWFGMLASTYLIEWSDIQFREFLKATPRPDHVQCQTWLDGLTPKIAQQLGIFIKKGTTTLYKWEPDMKEYPGQFLGKTLVRVIASNGSAHYVPRSDPVKSMASMFNPKKKYGSGQQLRIAQLTRVRDIIVMGAYHYPAHMHVANAYWRIFTAGPSGYKPGDSYEFEDTDDVLPPMFEFRRSIPTDRIPTYDECVELYLPLGVKSSTGVVMAGGKPQPPLVTAGDAIADLFDEVRMPGDRPTDWVTEETADKKNVMPSAPPTVDVAHAGRVVPLPEAVKRAWIAKMNAAREAARQKAGKIKVRDRFIGLKPGSKLAAYSRLFEDTAFSADYETADEEAGKFWSGPTEDDFDWDELQKEYGTEVPDELELYMYDTGESYDTDQ